MTNTPNYIGLNAVFSYPPQSLPGRRALTERYQYRPLKQLISRPETLAAVSA